jgi:hypothetical protein
MIIIEIISDFSSYVEVLRHLPLKRFSMLGLVYQYYVPCMSGRSLLSKTAKIWKPSGVKKVGVEKLDEV